MWRWTSAFLIFLCLSACVSTRSQDKTKAELLMNIGTAHYEKGNYPLALQELLKAEKLDPNNALIHNNLGLVYFMRERYDLAEQHIKKAIQIEPSFSDARNNLGRVLMEMKRDEEAEKSIKQALSDLTYAGGDRAWFNLGLLKFNQKKWPEAKDAFENSLKLMRDNCLANTYLGRTLFEMKSYPEAAGALDRAVGFCQRQLFDEPHYYAALAWFRAGDPAKAKARLQEIVRLYPEGKYRSRAQAMIPLIEKGIQ